jgi:hypothetical protein
MPNAAPSRVVPGRVTLCIVGGMQIVEKIEIPYFR